MENAAPEALKPDRYHGILFWKTRYLPAVAADFLESAAIHEQDPEVHSFLEFDFSNTRGWGWSTRAFLLGEAAEKIQKVSALHQ
jgi:hypothetical protein